MNTQNNIDRIIRESREREAAKAGEIQPVQPRSEFEDRIRIERIFREMQERDSREAGEALANLVCETPVVREIAGAVFSVLSIFGL
jgi:hypothetical protein